MLFPVPSRAECVYSSKKVCLWHRGHLSYGSTLSILCTCMLGFSVLPPGLSCRGYCCMVPTLVGICPSLVSLRVAMGRRNLVLGRLRCCVGCVTSQGELCLTGVEVATKTCIPKCSKTSHSVSAFGGSFERCDIVVSDELLWQVHGFVLEGCQVWRA